MKTLQHKQQPVQQPPCSVRPHDLPALKQYAVNNPAKQDAYDVTELVQLQRDVELRCMDRILPERKDDKSSEKKYQRENHKHAVTQPLVFGIVCQLGCLKEEEDIELFTTETN